jgi:hypothetical protein
MSRRLKRLLWSGFALCVGVVAIYFAGLIASRLDGDGWEKCERLRESYRARLKDGMSQVEVAAVTGYPHNYDRQFVWLWRFDVWGRPTARAQKWWDLYHKDRGDGVGVLYLFFGDDGRLISPALTDADTSWNPWHMYIEYAGLRMEEVEKRLGTYPSEYREYRAAMEAMRQGKKPWER